VPEKYQVLSRFSVDIKIEPVTGKIIDYEDKGIIYYADEKGNKVQDISERGDGFNYETIKTQAEIAKKEKIKIIAYEWIIPVLLGLIGIALVVVELRKKKWNGLLYFGI